MSSPAHEPADAFTAVLLQITQQAERVAALDERESAHNRDLAERLAELARQARSTSENLAKMQVTSARQSAVLGGLDGLDREVATLASRIGDLAGRRANDEDEEDGYQPAPVPRWWKLSGPEREQPLARLRAWVQQVYRPGYGHLAATLGPCWEQHPLCLYGLDWLMELWSILYLPPDRTAAALGSQAEWQTRLLPALAEQMHLETTRCEHAKAVNVGQGSGGTPRTAGRSTR